MAAGTAIQVQGVSKRYRLGQGPYLTLRESLSRLVRKGSVSKEEVWALRDLSFDVDEGEVLGLIGLNGAGKSTLLKILSRITEPTAGRSRTRGRVGALLEVGTGFHPELTGRENIFLNGVILGLRRSEVTRRLDEIVAFAGVEQFLDTPIKRYSSGMYLRLAFAVAAHVDPDIVIVDEVLAVGDVQFRQRCLGRMSEFAREGRTVVLVSHDLGSINQICERALWLEGGRLRLDGPSAAVVDAYVRDAVPRGAVSTFDPEPNKPIQLLSAAVSAADSDANDVLRRDRPFAVELRFVVRERIPGLSVAFILETSQGVRVLDEDWGPDMGGELLPAALPQAYSARLVVPPVLAPGDYVLVGWVGTQAGAIVQREVLAFSLLPGPVDTSEAVQRNRVVQPGVRWEVEEIEALDVTERAADSHA
jgi:ABC-2 type transport system ATP-binding protein/lipopolysaccharide transport system ATP-binding protein